MNLAYVDDLKKLFLELYHHQDLHASISMISHDINGFYEKKYQYHDFVTLFSDICLSSNHYDIIDIQLSLINDCLVQGTYHIQINQSEMQCFHITAGFHKQKINYLHISKEYNHDQKEIYQLFKESYVIGLCSYYLDDMHTYRFINQTLPKLLGYTKETYLQDHSGSLSAIDEDDREKVKHHLLNIINNEDNYSIEYRMIKKDGSSIWVLEQGKKILYEDQYIINAFISDITSLKNTELDLEVQKQKYSLALKDNSISILEYDIKNDSMIIDIQEEAKKKIYDHYLDYVASDRSTVFLEDKHLVINLFLRKINGPIEIREHIRGTNQYVRKLMDSTIIYDKNEQPAIVLATARDITTEWNHKFQLEKKVQTDSLTQLFNLESGKERINQYLQQVPHNYALFVLDIDYFKTVNDNYGHLFGNRVLVDFSKCLREIITEPHILIRIGGDEFMILLKDLNHQQSYDIAKIICQKVRHLHYEHELTITTSIGGCYVSDQKPYTFEQLFKQADKALYMVKNTGRNHFFLASIEEQIEIQDNVIDLNQMIQQALLDNEVFQQIMSYIGSYYQMNRISLLTMKSKYVQQHHLWFSSRSYQVADKEMIMDPLDLQLLNLTDCLIYQDNDECKLSKEFVSFLKQGVAKTMFILKLDSSHFLSCVSYTQHHTYQDELYQNIMFIYQNSDHQS